MLGKNKKGWIKILEAFIAILLLVGILTAVIVKANFRESGLAENIYEIQDSLLRKIQINQSLRVEVLSTIPTINSNQTGFSSMLNLTLRENTPSRLNCELVICAEIGSCLFDALPSSKEVYVRSIIVAANYQTYSPRKLNMFCWLKR